jgi:hypothetical protein
MIIQKVECNDCGRIKEYEAPETLSEVVFRLLTGGKLVEYEWYVEQCYSCESCDEYLFDLARGEEEADLGGGWKLSGQPVEGFWEAMNSDDEEDALPF